MEYRKDKIPRSCDGAILTGLSPDKERLECKRVRWDDRVAMRHLRFVYETMYQDLFPDAALRENWEQWSSYLKSGSEKDFFILCGTNLHHEQDATIHGFIVGIYLEPSHTGLMCYIGVDPDCRGKNIGKRLVTRLLQEMQSYALSKGAALRGLFAEVRDPDTGAAATGQDPFPARSRLRVYHAWHALQVPIDFSYPLLHAPWRKGDGMLLLSLPVNGRHPAPDDIIGMVRDYYAGFSIDPAHDTDFLRIQDELRAWRGYIPLSVYTGSACRL